MDPIVTALVNLGLGGILIAAFLTFAWYHITRQIPKLLDLFAEQLTKERAHFAEQLNQERDLCKLWHAENMSEHQAIVSEIREAKHAVKDVAQTMRLKQAVADALADNRPKEPS